MESPRGKKISPTDGNSLERGMAKIPLGGVVASAQ